MNILTAALTIAGLALFEVVSSIDNAIINAEVLNTMSARARRWFLTWGIFFAVFVVRGLLPWLIVWLVMPGVGPIGAFTATFSSDPAVAAAIQMAAPVLLVGGGMFLVLLFFHWIFMEEKPFALPHEPWFARQAPWFFAIASIVLVALVWLALGRDPFLALGAVIGSSAFFISHGFKQYAEEAEKDLTSSTKSDFSKIAYLEVIDLTFSIDGVLGAFAFTMAVPLILLGNGIGAVVVRQMTIGNIERIKKYRFLKHGAMYSILVLGGVMLGHAFGLHIPEWASPVATFTIIGYFFWRSAREIRAIPTA